MEKGAQIAQYRGDGVEVDVLEALAASRYSDNGTYVGYWADIGRKVGLRGGSRYEFRSLRRELGAGRSSDYDISHVAKIVLVWG